MVGFLLGSAPTERAVEPVSSALRAQIGCVAAGTGSRSAGRGAAGKRIFNRCDVHEVLIMSFYFIVSVERRVRPGWHPPQPGIYIPSEGFYRTTAVVSGTLVYFAL